MSIFKEAKEIADYFFRKTRGRFKYPYQSNKSEDYNITFSKRSKEYVNTIKHFPTSDLSKHIQNKVNSIEKLSDGLIDVVNTYLNGSASSAYSKFDILMNERTNILFDLSHHFSKDYKFYRARISDGEINKREEIFHIPFHLRHLVDMQRYSIAGVPSLYLGNTIYSCWLELDKPILNNLYISKFEVEEKISVIDFTLNLELLKKIENISDKKLKAFYELFPLILACGFNKKHSNSSFNVEYIIPSMLLQWISREKSNFDGLIYLSTKMSHLDMNSVGSNIVLPVKDISLDNSKKFCSNLTKNFRLTPPVSWEILKSLKDSTFLIPYNNINKARNNINEILENHYEHTDFYTVETRIDLYLESSKIT